MIRVLIFGLLIYIAYRLLRFLARSLLKSGDRDAREDDRSESAELIQDPQCGTYFLKQHGTKTVIAGETIFFCSEKCRDSYLKSR